MQYDLWLQPRARAGCKRGPVLLTKSAFGLTVSLVSWFPGEWSDQGGCVTSALGTALLLFSSEDTAPSGVRVLPFTPIHAEQSHSAQRCSQKTTRIELTLTQRHRPGGGRPTQMLTQRHRPGGSRPTQMLRHEHQDPQLPPSQMRFNITHTLEGRLDANTDICTLLVKMAS